MGGLPPPSPGRPAPPPARGHTWGRRTAGAAYCWGGNGFGQLGTGSTGNSTIPLAVSGGLGFSTLAAGAFHTSGVTSGGGGDSSGAAFSAHLAAGNGKRAGGGKRWDPGGGRRFQ